MPDGAPLPARVPPHDAEAERAVIAAVLVSSATVLDELRLRLRPEQFYSDRHRRIFETALALDAQGTRADLVTVAAELRRTDRLAQVGGTAYLAELSDATPAVANVEAHAAIVASHARTRAVIAVGQQIAAEGYGDVGDSQQWCSDAAQRLAELADEATASDTLSLVTDASGPLLEALRSNDDGALGRPVATGIASLDRKLGGGLRRGSMYVLGGRPGMGKSALARGIGLRIAKRGEGVAIISAEMPTSDVMICAWSHEARIDNSLISQRRLDREQWTRVAQAVADVGALPITIDDRARPTMAQVRASARRSAGILQRRHGVRLGLIVLDYLQLLKGVRHRGDSRESEVATLSSDALALAREMDCPVLALSQLNRDKARVGWQAYKLEDLRESGAIEQDAFGVLFVHRNDVEQKDPHAQDGKADIIVAKIRQAGTLGRVEVLFDGPTTRFSEAHEDVWATSNYDDVMSFGPTDYD